jgi:hypothetical protein
MEYGKKESLFSTALKTVHLRLFKVNISAHYHLRMGINPNRNFFLVQID